MQRLVVAMALLTGCRGDRDQRASFSPPAPAVATSVSASPIVPKLPSSPDGVEELRVIDGQVAQLRSDPVRRVSFVTILLGRAGITQRLEDFVDAVAVSEAAIKATPDEPAAWKGRAQALSRVHRFAAAREAVDHLKAIDPDGSWRELVATIDEATGHPELAAPVREETAKILNRPEAFTQLAANLALRGKLDEAIALIPKAAAAARDNSPVVFAWLDFQWGRLYEQAGQMSRARDLFADAHRRLPSYLEAIVHLAGAMSATGQDPRALITAALAENPHPELLALAGKTAEAKVAWERYVAALPEAFSDHAARFYLGPGADPARALVLAQANLENRDTPEARSLVVEAALAANDPVRACSVVDPLVTAPLRAQQFIAWRALSSCGRKADADRLAAVLGIR
jgi:tetratricopeptide (TPR) repeat protein